MVQQVDKSVVVMGGFGDKSVGDAEAFLRELLQHVDGFQDVTMTQNQPPLGSVQFSCPAQAMKFIRSHKTQNQLMVDWLHDEIPTKPVKIALHEFISDME